MGFFQKKLDYSSGNGILPKLSESEYLNLRAPSSSMVRVPNLDLMSREQDQGKLDSASGATADEAFSDSNETIIKVTVEKYLGAFVRRVAKGLGDDGVQLIGRFMAVGCGMHFVESKSGLQIPGKVHPSIANVIFIAIRSLPPEVKQDFQGFPQYKSLLETAIEIGYFAMRTNGTQDASELLKFIQPN
jgi:hypothetical protein